MPTSNESTQHPRKLCNACAEWKPVDAFHKNGLTKQGKVRRRSTCKACRTEQVSAAERRERAEARQEAAGGAKRAGPELPTAHARIQTQGGRAIKWIERYCVGTKGRFRGEPLKLLPWQRVLLLRLLQMRDARPGDPHPIRRYRRALVGVPKKNGKTELIAALALWFLLDEPYETAPEIAVAAAIEEQADLLFGAAKAMCEQSPKLKSLVELSASRINAPGRPGAVIERVAAGGGNLDGRNYSAILLDELHEWTTVRSIATYRVLTNATIARLQPIIIQITTAGWDQETICYRQYTYGHQVNNGEVEDDTFFFWWQEAAEEIDYSSEEAFVAANPSAGLTVTYERFLEDVRQKPENEVRRYNLNQWTEAEAAWLPPGAWDLCRSDSELDLKARTIVAIDAATRHDSTAIVWAQEQGDAIVIRSRIWERPIDPRTNTPNADWRLPIEEVKEQLRWLMRTYDVTTIGYDPAFITWVADELENEGLPMLEIPQTASRMVPGSQALYEYVIQQRLRHDGDPTLTRHVRNAVAAAGPSGGWRLAKGKAKRPMDGAIALAMVMYLVANEVDPAPLPMIFV